MLSPQYDQSFKDILLDEGLISPDDLTRLLGERESTTESLGEVMVRRGMLSERDRTRCVGRLMSVPFVELAFRPLDSEAARLIPQAMSLRLLALPIERSETAISVAMANPLDISALDQLRQQTGLEIDPYIATADDLREAIARAFGSYDDLEQLVGEARQDFEDDHLLSEADLNNAALLQQLAETSEEAPISRLVNGLFAKAVAARASDIHIGPEKDRVRVRFRVDGMLMEVMSVPKQLQYPLLSRLKITSNMDIAERRMPQDGRMTLTTTQGEYDMRVSTYPSVHGENMVLRILDKDSSRLTLQKLGIAPDTRQEIERLIFRPHGMFLVCGPTGSGKTTTLYACLNALNSVERNIMTIEDPVEYQLTGIVQGSVNPKAGITFAAGLRSLVRQDPDVLLVGEIRDTETARIAVEAALTGHLVLSTIHANDAASAVTRLVDMGVEPFLVASALSAALAQRLMRVVCQECACPALLDEKTAQTLRAEGWSNLESAKLRRGAGCEACSKSGFRGRTGIHELMEVNPEIQRLILARASSQEIAEIALRGRRSLRQDAFSKMLGGATTYEEVLRVTV